MDLSTSERERLEELLRDAAVGRWGFIEAFSAFMYSVSLTPNIEATLKVGKKDREVEVSLKYGDKYRRGDEVPLDSWKTTGLDAKVLELEAVYIFEKGDTERLYERYARAELDILLGK